MKRNIFALIILLTISFILPQTIHAKWWIFGKPDEDVSFGYLHINGISFDEKNVKITLYKNTLPNGMIEIRGKARTQKNKVGTVYVSTNNKEKWEKARLAEDGTFDYAFKPQTGVTYHLFVKVIDTTGKANDIEATHKEVTVSDRDIRSVIDETLRQMVEAYQDENTHRFMNFVSDNFAGDPIVLDRAISKDFTALDNINLRFTITGIAAGTQGKVFVSLLYNRFVIASKTGRSLNDKGTTEFVFELADNGAKVFSMKNPLIFGLSDAGEVATGNTISPTSDPVIVIDANGNVTTAPFGSAGLTAPSNLRITPSMPHMVLNLAWDEASGASEYVIYESLTNNGPWTEVQRTANTSYALTTNNIATLSAFLYYYVKAANANGNLSNPSNIVEFDNM